MSKFTAGPWHVDERNEVRDSCNDLVVAEILGENREIYTANAHLISAAPDMLTALYKLRRDDFPEWEQPVWNEIQAAIAKAEGRKF